MNFNNSNYLLLRHRKVPAPFSIIAENINNNKLGTNNQKLILFSLGNAISGPPTNKGNKKLPKPPIKAGILCPRPVRGGGIQ